MQLFKQLVVGSGALDLFAPLAALTLKSMLLAPLIRSLRVCIHRQTTSSFLNEGAFLLLERMVLCF